MHIPESKEVTIQRMSEDPRIIGHLVRVMVMGDYSTVPDEFRTADDMTAEFGVSHDDFMLAADIARAKIDEDILGGRLDIL